MSSVDVVQSALAAGVPGVRRIRVPGIVRWVHPETGNTHRIDGPAETASGTQAWYVDGVMHREDGPAETTLLYVRWHRFGEVHRVDGPATEYYDGRRDWCVRGQVIDDPVDRSELSRLYDAGALTRLELVLSAWRPGGPSVVELSAAIAAAVS